MEIKEALIQIEKEQIKSFLASFDLKYDEDIDTSLYIEEDGEMIATISKSENIIKCVAIKKEYQDCNLTATLINNIISKMNQEKIYSYLLFTKNEYEKTFINLGFRKIVSTNNLVLLEGGLEKIDEAIDRIATKVKYEYGDISGNTKVASVVVNANPVTLGHKYLIEKASKENDLVLVFVVEEDKSDFDFNTRLSLVYLACKTFENVVVLPSTKYIVSKSTFPTYFLKDDVVESEIAYVDALIFKNYFMKALNISKRYVGTETKKKMTSYNQTLKEILGDSLIEVERLKEGEKIVSASEVRKLFSQKKFDEGLEFIPLECRLICKMMAQKIYE